MTHPSPSPLRTLALAGSAAALLALAACGKPADAPTTVGQKVDAAVASTERAAADVKSEVQAATAQAKESGSAAVNAVATTASDINITAKVNAELAKDPALSALSINVDTTAGRVALNGTAPSEAARSRATGLAAGVEGVVSVDNRLKIDPKKS